MKSWPTRCAVVIRAYALAASDDGDGVAAAEGIMPVTPMQHDAATTAAPRRLTWHLICT